MAGTNSVIIDVAFNLPARITIIGYNIKSDMDQVPPVIMDGVSSCFVLNMVLPKNERIREVANMPAPTN
jgi:hypothetical protein